ncbi:hypothetical protein BDV30DRAFT_195124 [Aspergillus minisclerotigenes]|uniref:Uncharacterized protein n=1 Tax=Aspergillus minisclerotigenes TaxID=656917 RepID=A0A5N6ISJ8_9EURO|nr:hypothetical protein BDV30DRAFT_195124 [Aspergillus minisclerotigenes]
MSHCLSLSFAARTNSLIRQPMFANEHGRVRQPMTILWKRNEYRRYDVETDMTIRPAILGPMKEQRTKRLVACMSPRLLRTVAAETENAPQDDGRRSSDVPPRRFSGIGGRGAGVLGKTSEGWRF